MDGFGTDQNLYSKLKPLNPFIDGEGLLRVGGRLEYANISYEQKHPIILPKSHYVTELFLRGEHERLLHAGTQTTLSVVRQKYWPIDGRNTIKKLIHKCVKCARFKAAAAEQLMGSLPVDRVNVKRPFLAVGVDYAGPVMLRASRQRKAPQIKAYIVLFVCMSTKAVHLDLVTELSTEAFIATLKRFVSRRGKCSIIHSDNGKNFVGANKELSDLFKFFKAEENKRPLISAVTQLGITWQFTPTYAPHFGDLWEGSIKIMKSHLRRVIGSHCLTYEEYVTLLTQVEAVLNSRPLLSMSDDSTDASYLSPSHFLIGDIMTPVPEPYNPNLSANKLKIYKQITTMRDQFWKTWSNQYLNQLQTRHKWSDSCSNLKIDSVVLIKEDNAPPLYWQLARIVDIKPGADGKVRVVNIKTNKGIYTRPITKIVPLPIE
ncbi:uncharacterized protein LOC113366789 [Ctenocephalides felis]|uniref:uncharacterized protein LOC113366789 n=1 Tax=Ctenocephalides felis TaxID=7515 RepID=UPI000E6E3913|nr:uncharacterized protein LOC113366789 [Ctenocephalides felis]